MVNLIVSTPAPEGVAGGNLVTSQPASCNVNSRSFCHPTFGLSCLARQPISAAPSSQHQQSSSLCRPDATTNGTAQGYEVSLRVFVRTAHSVETVNSATSSQPVSQPARAPIPDHPATRTTVFTRDQRQVDKPPSLLGQILLTQKISSRRAEEAVIATTGIKEAAKNEWTPQRQMLHQPGLHGTQVGTCRAYRGTARSISIIMSGPACKMQEAQRAAPRSGDCDNNNHKNTGDMGKSGRTAVGD